MLSVFPTAGALDSAVPSQLEVAPGPQPKKSHLEVLANVYYAVSWIFGFKERYSLALCAWKIS
jgi:hypothetical protein